MLWIVLFFFLSGFQGPNGTSPMSWLLSQYLENLAAATSQNITFNSRVRRLSHMLVHRDPNGPEPEELKSPLQCSESSSMGQIKV